MRSALVIAICCLAVAACVTAQPVPRPGLNIGLQDKGSDVAKNGVAAQEWIVHPP